MRAFKLKTLTAVAAAKAVLTVPGVALANGGDIHFGAVPTGIPMVAVYIVGGFVGAVVLFFLANWARYRRAQSRGNSSPRPGGLQRRLEEEDDGTR
jgi:hypothetical protein